MSIGSPRYTSQTEICDTSIMQTSVSADGIICIIMYIIKKTFIVMLLVRLVYTWEGNVVFIYYIAHYCTDLY